MERLRIRRGIRTTEFWILILSNVAIIAAAFEGVLPPKWAAIATAISSSTYSITRQLIKFKNMS